MPYLSNLSLHGLASTQEGGLVVVVAPNERFLLNPPLCVFTGVVGADLWVSVTWVRERRM